MADLLSPLIIRNLTLWNRIVMPPIARDLATSKGEVTPELITHYLGRLGVSLIIVEHSYVNPDGRASEHQLGIYDDFLIPALKELVDKIHQADYMGDTKVGIQITYGGSKSSKDLIGSQPLAPSPIKHPGMKEGEIPKELTKLEMEKIKDYFVHAAVRAKEAGFDIVELHGAHGYLLNQFFSPLTNIREDEYGGSFVNRLRFPLEVVKAVREAVGPGFPLFYRLGTDDFLAGGLTVKDGIKASPLLEAAGVDVLDLSGGLRGYSPAGDEEGFFNYLAEAIKPVFNGPVLVTGGIKDYKYANEIVKKGVTDLVGIGRAFLEDRSWARRAVEYIR